MIFGGRWFDQGIILSANDPVISNWAGGEWARLLVFKPVSTGVRPVGIYWWDAFFWGGQTVFLGPAGFLVDTSICEATSPSPVRRFQCTALI